jgi:hypothetical protein
VDLAQIRAPTGERQEILSLPSLLPLGELGVLAVQFFFDLPI